MDQIFAVAFQGLFVYLGLALAFMVLVAVLRSPRFKGWRGERAVQNTIRQKLNPLIYVDLHNVTLPTKDGSTQIDHLIFSPYGLFVLETKNYQGWILVRKSSANGRSRFTESAANFRIRCVRTTSTPRPCRSCWALAQSMCIRSLRLWATVSSRPRCRLR